jgi:hypothetical protein
MVRASVLLLAQAFTQGALSCCSSALVRPAQSSTTPQLHTNTQPDALSALNEHQTYATLYLAKFSDRPAGLSTLMVDSRAAQQQ